jgi:hypothetical protein
MKRGFAEGSYMKAPRGLREFLWGRSFGAFCWALYQTIRKHKELKDSYKFRNLLISIRNLLAEGVPI